MITWVIQQDSDESKSAVNQSIIDHLANTEHPLHEIKIVPFERSVVGGAPKIDGPVVVYGSTAIDTVVAQNNWSPGVWRSEGFRESAVHAALGDLYMNADMVTCSVRDAPTVAAERGWEFFFVKPNTDSKEFAGTVTDQQKYPYFVEPMLAYEWVDDDFEVCVSPVMDIGIEWRLVVVDKTVVEYSIYRQYREVMASREIYQDVIDVANQAIALHNPAPVYIIDIAQVNGQLKIIEYNGFNSAGLYACDVGNIIDAINTYLENQNAH